LGGGPDVSWGGLSDLPSGHSRSASPSSPPLRQRRPRPGEKPSGFRLCLLPMSKDAHGGRRTAVLEEAPHSLLRVSLGDHEGDGSSASKNAPCPVRRGGQGGGHPMESSPERSGPSVLRRPQSAGRPQGRDPIQFLSATLSYMQSTWNPRMWPRAVHVRGSTWTPWRSTSKGVTKGMVERAGGHLCLRSGATRRSAGHGRGSGQPSATR
jgi:hypothetical protein